MIRRQPAGQAIEKEMVAGWTKVAKISGAELRQKSSHAIVLPLQGEAEAVITKSGLFGIAPRAAQGVPARTLLAPQQQRTQSADR